MRQLDIQNVDFHELDIVLMTFFDTWTYGNDEIFYTCDSEKLHVKYNKKWKILEKPKFNGSKTLYDEIIKEINSINIQNEHKYAEKYIYSFEPINAEFNYKNKIILKRLPSEAQQPPFSWAKHAVKLEVKYNGHHNPRLNALRSQKALREAELLLVALDSKIRSNTSSNSRHEWVIDTSDPNNWSTKYLSVGYHFDKNPSSNQSETAQPQSFTENIETPLDKYFNLEQTKMEQFLRACFWLDNANEIYCHSRSAAYIALINAIETLLPDSSSDTCKVCNKPTKSISANFREFLDNYVPNELENNYKNELYDLRSKLTHGKALLILDQQIGGMGVRDKYERYQYRDVEKIVRIALRNWLSE